MNSTWSRGSVSTMHTIPQQIELLEATITEHYKQISAVRNRICDLKSAMNSAAAISRLHPEVLEEVFFQHVLDANATGHIMEPHFHWTTVLHVCRAWRQLAFRSPRLWTMFRSTSPAFVRESIQRSGILPLDILAPLSDPPEDLTILSFQLIFEQVARIRSAEIMLTPALRETLREARWSQLGAPLLESLDLTAYADADDLAPFTTMLMPKLTSLKLFRGSFGAVRILARPCITHLTLAVIRNVSLPQLLDVVGRLPALTSLSLNNVCELQWPFSAETWGTPIPAENLRHLAHLSIVNGTAFSTAFILHHLHIPPQTNARLYSREVALIGEVLSMTQYIRERVFLPLRTPPFDETRQRRPPIHALRMHLVRDLDPISLTPGTIKIRVSAWTEDVTEETRRYEDARFDFRIRSPDYVLGVLGTELFVHAELGSVTTMEVSCASYVMQSLVWATLFTAMPNLRRLTLSDNATRSFVAYHNPSTLHHAQHAIASPLLYPSLKHLQLTDTRLNRCWSGPHRGDLLAELAEVLALLRDQGLYLEKLELTTPINLPENGLAILRDTQCAEVVELMDSVGDSVSECSTDQHAGFEDEDEDDSEMDGPAPNS